MNSKILGVLVLSTLALPVSAQQAGNAQAATAVNSACAGCHSIPGYQSSFPQVYRVPMIAGQSAKYIESALQAYKRGERNHPSMKAIAQGLTDQQMADLAAYYAARGASTSVASK
jgi:cytochrome c553